MKIDSLTGVFRFFKEPAKTATEQSQSNTQTETPRESAEAVKVAGDFGRGVDNDVGKRRAKVDELKKQVERGAYRPDSKQVAIAVAKDLFI